MKILLFDIDGTLMLSGGAGRRAIDRAFFELYGISDAFGEVVPDGNTDPKIFSEIMDNHDVAVADRTAAFAVLAERYAERIGTTLDLIPKVLGWGHATAPIEFDAKVAEYRSCLETFVGRQNEAMQKHKQAADNAAEAWKRYAETVLKVKLQPAEQETTPPAQ